MFRIGLQNDHKAIMKEIENGLQGYYSSSTNLQSSEAQLTHNFENHVLTHRMPFAKVTLVSPGSPAEYSVRTLNYCDYKEKKLITL